MQFPLTRLEFVSSSCVVVVKTQNSQLLCTIVNISPYSESETNSERTSCDNASDASEPESCESAGSDYDGESAKRRKMA